MSKLNSCRLSEKPALGQMTEKKKINANNSLHLVGIFTGPTKYKMVHLDKFLSWKRLSTTHSDFQNYVEGFFPILSPMEVGGVA